MAVEEYTSDGWRVHVFTERGEKDGGCWDEYRGRGDDSPTSMPKAFTEKRRQANGDRGVVVAIYQHYSFKRLANREKSKTTSLYVLHRRVYRNTYENSARCIDRRSIVRATYKYSSRKSIYFRERKNDGTVCTKHFPYLQEGFLLRGALKFTTLRYSRELISFSCCHFNNVNERDAS